MKYGLKRIDAGHKTGILVALIVTILSLIPLLILIPGILRGGGGLDIFYVLLYPVAHFFVAYLVTRLFLFFYNLFASRTGPIIIELEKVEIEEEDIYNKKK